ncbi:hypothetical protein [Microvirga sp. M2]|uniref:hypothetical protein n=1 Tax=Microvirga sp. M2 TaxID=3073270 RepID=UPI0039C126D3
MKRLSASLVSGKSLLESRIVFAVALGIAAGIALAPLPAEAAHASREVPVAQSVKAKGATVAAKDIEETGSIQARPADTSTCDRSRKRLFVKGEGWIVRRVTTCY